MEPTEWICTDPDTNQWGRQLSDTVYEFKQDDNEGVYGAEIDLTQYSAKQKESTINAYGYTLGKEKPGLRNLYELYGKDAGWILAECIFEMEVK